MLLFKFLAQAATKAALLDDGCFTLRFNLPSDYNDPYELLLLPEGDLTTAHQRAFYQSFIATLPQAPMTCFSKRPDSPLMWAHYGQISSGICLCLDEDKLFEQIAELYVCDVDYTDDPATISARSIQHAATTMKNRHLMFLLTEANRTAYFRKRSHWSYEAERRVVVTEDQTEEVHGMMLGSYTSDAIRSIILGPSATADVVSHVEAFASRASVPVLRMKYSRRSPEPIFYDDAQSYFWSDSSFERYESACEACREPLVESDDSEVCKWCELTDEELGNARNRQQTMMLINTGILPGLPLLFSGLEKKGFDSSPSTKKDA